MATCTVSGWVSRDYRLLAPIEVSIYPEDVDWYGASDEKTIIFGYGPNEEDALEDWVDTLAASTDDNYLPPNQRLERRFLVYDPAVANDVRPVLRWQDRGW